MMIKFDPAKHEYLVDGKAVPSVTQIVAPLGADYDDMDELTELAVDAAAERGTVMHAYIEHRLQGGAREDFELPDEYGIWADGADLLLEEHRIEPLMIEQPLGCEDYAGTPDLVCNFDGQLAILDWKFVSTVAKSKVGAQLAGYAKLLFRSEVFPDLLAAVQFLQDGTYRLYKVGIAGALDAFSTCWRLYEIKTRKHPRGGIF